MKEIKRNLRKNISKNEKTHNYAKENLFPMRKLTENEILYLMKDLESLFPNFLCHHMKMSYLNSMFKGVRENLEKEWIEDDYDEWDTLKDMLEKMVSKAVIQGGESVGVICAQSIGERQTQLSVDGETRICYQKQGQWYQQKIKDVVDPLMLRDTAVLLKRKEHEIYPCWNTEEYKIPMIDSQGNLHLASIIEWSRHKNKGKLMTMTTKKYQKRVKTTLSHSYVIKKKGTEKEIEPVLGEILRKGDEIPLLLYEMIDTVTWEREQVTFDSVDTIEYEDDTENQSWVYDISVEGNQTFMIENGIFVHNTLNSFHQSGLAVATVVTGVPRFMELLNATKDLKLTSNSFLFTEKNKTLSQYREMIGNQLIETHLYDLSESDKLFTMDQLEDFWFHTYEIIYGNSFRQWFYGITFFLDKKKLYERRITLLDIKTSMENQYADIICVISPLHMAQIHVFIDESQIKLSELDETVHRTFFIKHNPIEIYLKQVVRPKLLELKISGITNISKYYFQKLESKDWKIETEGSNFIEILSLPFVHKPSAKSNNMWDIYHVMGIEATRQFLIDEFTNVVSSDGTFINPSHILLLVDIMTYQGNINSISRYGMKREEMGVLSRSSFEESLDQFCKAGCFTEKEPIRAVSAKIMCGRRSTIGSGFCDLRMDWNKIKNYSDICSETIVDTHLTTQIQHNN